MSCTPLPKAAKAVWAKLLTRLPCLVVCVKFQLVYNTKSKMGSQLLLASISSHVQLWRRFEKAFSECLGVSNVFPTAAKVQAIVTFRSIPFFLILTHKIWSGCNGRSVLKKYHNYIISKAVDKGDIKLVKACLVIYIRRNTFTSWSLGVLDANSFLGMRKLIRLISSLNSLYRLVPSECL